MHNGKKDWQIRQHQNFSHHNHLHQSLAPRSSREVFGKSIEVETGHRPIDTVIFIVACVTLLALVFSRAFV